LERLKKGETILLCKRNEPIAEIRPLPAHPQRKRPIGLAKGQLTIPRDFFDPLPEDVIQAFQAQS
jgi:antitoxin (DNA-binding transcriptional repressor) of toxin-antitoxin stability system